MFERWSQLNSCEFVDMIIPFDTEADLYNLLVIIEPDVRLVGDEYEGTNHTGHKLGKIIYNSRKHEYSSTMYRGRVTGYGGCVTGKPINEHVQ